MPPRRRPNNVVSSGNAGNSSKAASSSSAAASANTTKKDDPKSGGSGGTAAADAPRPPPLFPVGYKSPVTILNEKCQKNGWERAVVDTRQNGGSPPTWTGSVTLKKRVSKNVYELDSVRLTPHPPLEIESAALAKHFAATYALFRFCSHLPLAMVLPPVIRPYWSTLLAEKAAAPEHREWEWHADPFAAKREVEERQKRRAEKERAREPGMNGEGGGGGGGGGGGSGGPGKNGGGPPVGGGGRGWDDAPEVRMAPGLREMVEGTVRKMMSRFPSAILEASRSTSASTSTTPAASGTSTPALDLASVQNQLTSLGFRPAHIASCLSALASAHARLHAASSSAPSDPLVLSLSFLSPFEASIEWLLLHLPEDDLPPRYRPGSSSSDFITGSSGKQALTTRWLADKLIKKAGFPRKAVEQVLAGSDETEEVRESAVLDKLGRRLCGWTSGEDGWGEEEYEGWARGDVDAEERQAARDEEILALEAVLGDRYAKLSPNELVVSIPSLASSNDSISLHVILDDASPYPSAQYPTYPPSFFIESESVPSYMRLWLHRQLLAQFRDESRGDLRSVLESGAGGAVLGMVEYLEGALDEVLDNPPDVGMVTEHLVPKVQETVKQVVNGNNKREARKQRGPTRWREPTKEEHERVRRQQERMREAMGYEAMMDERRRLPAWKERDRIVEALERERVMVVVGETGCGKSTQLPQFILDHEIEQGRGASTNIIVTQPRRVAAMGVASRVANERMEDVDKSSNGGGGTVGYAIRGERRASRDTRLLFCTTGVVLRRLGTGDRDLEGVSHVVVDEAHERGVDTDLLICLLRDLLERNKRIKIVLMSATINEQIFINYFGGCPSLTIPGFTHPVTDHYLEDVLPLINYQPQPSRFGPRQTEEQKSSLRNSLSKLNLPNETLRALEVISTSDRLDYGLVAAMVRHIIATSSSTSTSGAILIFMPGVPEIRQCIDALQQAPLGGPTEILPLHANLSSAEQKRVFLSTGTRRKIVVATNVAETSVTIPDVVFVVDGGRVKETQYEVGGEGGGMQKLVEGWTSRASGRQRRGRAGRTQPGHCYKLYTRLTEQNSMARFPIPEMLRTPLEALFLQVKAMDEDTDVKAFLGRAIDPPKMQAMEAAWRVLVDLGAVEGEDYSSRLTALGRHMSMIPVDLRLAKMLVLGTIFKCLDPVLTIAALLSAKPLFISPMDKRDEAKKAREAFASAKSDLLTDAKAYEACMALRGQGAIRQYCEQNFISASTLRDVSTLRQDFLSALASIGFVGMSQAEVARLSVNAGQDNLVKAVLVGGLYPRVARIAMPQAQFERVQQGSIQKDHEAKSIKLFDCPTHQRVFLHPSSVLFAEPNLKPGFLAYFAKAETSKVFLRDATDVPLYGLLLFGGAITINHFKGGVMVGKGGEVRMRGGVRVGVLCSQLRRLLDAQLAEMIERPGMMDMTGHEEVTGAMMALLARDGLST